MVEILSLSFWQTFCSAIHLAIGFCSARADLRELRPADAVLEDGDHDRVLRRFLSLLCGEQKGQNSRREVLGNDSGKSQQGRFQLGLLISN